MGILVVLKRARFLMSEASLYQEKYLTLSPRQEVASSPSPSPGPPGCYTTRCHSRRRTHTALGV